MKFLPIFVLAYLASLSSSATETWFHMMGGNIREDGLRLDLEAIRAAGLTGIQLFHIGDRGGPHQKGRIIWPGCEKRQIQCMEDGWTDFIHLVGTECRRLGLTLDVQNCPGWSQSGGPWIDHDHAQRQLSLEPTADPDRDWRPICRLAFPTPSGENDGELKPERKEKTGDASRYVFDHPVTVRTLTQPPISPIAGRYKYHAPFMHVKLEARGADGWIAVMDGDVPKSNWRDYVHGVSFACDEVESREWRYTFTSAHAVTKIPEPRFFAKARHSNWEGKAAWTLRSVGRDRGVRQSRACWIDGDRIIDVSGKKDWKREGWTVLEIGHINPGYVNSPAPPEATGWECDKLDPRGIEAHFNGYVGKLAAGPLKGLLRGMVVDSWECWCQNWTQRMEEYFEGMNGYRLRRFLPALFGYVVDSPEATEKFLTDWRRTLGALVTKNYYGRMAELAHSAGLECYYETAFGDIIYGDILEYWKYSDRPMCEFWYPFSSLGGGGIGCLEYKQIRPCASAAHIYGKRRVAAEAFTEDGISWNEDFAGLMDCINRAFARGVTFPVLHNYTHAPVPDQRPPGACLGGYNGTPFSRLQTWWKEMPEFTSWMDRCGKFLEAGLPVQDILWYLGDAADHSPSDGYPLPEGFRADYLNHDVLANRLSVVDGELAIPEGTRWKVLWVPDDRFLTSSTKAALDRIAKAGGRVVFGGKDALVKALAKVTPDVITEPRLGDGPSDDFMWIHRHVDGFERYFVAAGTNGWNGRVTFRAEGPVSFVDTVTGERRAWRNGTVLPIAPSRSVFVEFGMKGTPRSDEVVALKTEFAPWRLSFEPGWGVPESVTLDRLVPWCEIDGFSREAKAYSGRAVYESAFTLTEDAVRGRRLELDLGAVGSLVNVEVNGHGAGTLWCAPYRCDITSFVKPGRNELRLEVVSTWRNRFIYELSLPEKDRRLWFIHQPHYNPRAAAPFDRSGLLGPVRVISPLNLVAK